MCFDYGNGRCIGYFFGRNHAGYNGKANVVPADATTQITWTTFILKADTLDGQNKRIVIKSNGAMNASVLKNDMFTLKDGSKTIAIDSIEAGNSAEEIIINTKETFSADTTVGYHAIVQDETTDQLYYLVNADGVLYASK